MRTLTAPLAAASLLALAACASSTTPTGRFYGAATPTPPGPLCQPAKAVAQIRNQVLIFAPDEGTWILEGLANPDGTLTADRARPIARGQTWITSFEGRWTPTTISGTYKTPRCTYAIALQRP